MVSLLFLCLLPPVLNLAHCIECVLQDHLFGWIKKLGGYVSPKLELSAGSDSSWSIRGLFATEDIAYDELLCSLPPEALLCTGPGDKGECRLVTRLREEIEKGKESPFDPYLAVLEFQHPIIWSHLELELLADLPLNFNEFNQTYREWCGLDLLDPHTAEVASLAWSRQSWLGSHCMIPVLDLLNHGGVLKNVDWSESLGMYQMKAITNIAQGTQLLTKYDGPTPELFRMFGFLEEPPRQWYFDGLNGKRQFFTVGVGGNVQLKARGEASLDHFASSAQSQLKKLQAREDEFARAAALYKGKPERLELVKAYRQAFMEALWLGLEASTNNREL